MKGPNYSIGERFLTRGKHPKLCTIIDIFTTLNSAGEVVKIRYMATHNFLGKTVTDCDVVETTVSMGIAALQFKNKGV